MASTVVLSEKVAIDNVIYEINSDAQTRSFMGFDAYTEYFTHFTAAQTLSTNPWSYSVTNTSSAAAPSGMTITHNTL